jgi:uncharacterized membrane protein YgdD (TMEM256/DUF423 family)
MTNSLAIRLSALLGFLAVILGASGAHGHLADILVQNQTADLWQKAVFYHFIHTVVLLVLATRTPVHVCQWISFVVGILLFSGSLYVMALTNVRWLAHVTPFGGVSFLVGWLWLFFAPLGKKGA